MSDKEDVIARRTRSSTKKSSYVEEYIVSSDSSQDSSDDEVLRSKSYIRSIASRRQNQTNKPPICQILEKNDNLSDQPRTPRKQKSKIPEEDLIVDSPVTPPKQQKPLTKQNVLSPSSLLNRLNLSSPPSKTNGNALKQLFEEDVSFQSARKALHSSIPTCMPGRDKEHEELSNFIEEHLNSTTSSTLYISGPPGTGKTASLSIILQKPEVNCFFYIYIYE